MASFKPKKNIVELENPDSDIVAIIDGDYAIFSVATVAETVTIEAVHKASGRKKAFKNKTEFWGRSKKTIGGWLGEQNAERKADGKSEFTPEDFDIVQVQKRKVEYNDDGDELTEDESLWNVLHSVKVKMLSDLNKMCAGSYKCYMSGSSKYRHDLSTLMEYKGNRKDTLKPLVLDDVAKYVSERFDSEKVEGIIETDDKVVMVAYGNPNYVILGEDKDHRAQPVKFFDVNNPEEGIIDGDCFGGLFVKQQKSGKKVLGNGRMFLYFQILSGDSSDNYKANYFSEVKWADMSAYDALVDCKDDEEALNVMMDCYKNLYPKAKTVVGWRGDEIKIDWKYVINENFQMARMLRWEDDFMTFPEWCKGYGVKVK